MFRRRRSPSRLLLGVLLVLAGSQTAAADDVASFLERMGLNQVLAVHLEDQLHEADPDDREAIALRLAPLYSHLLQSVTDAEQRAALEARSRALLRQVPEDAADELRLALLRAPFRAAEITAEQHRLRQADDEAVANAIASFESAVPQLESLREQFGQLAQSIERRRNRSSGTEQAALNERLERLHALHADATFLQAWSLYYQTLLTGREQYARSAQYLFAELLDLETPEPRGVSLDLRALEPVARSILGLALCKSQFASTAAAFEWLDLLDVADSFEPVRSQLPAWRLVVLLEHNEYRSALDMIQLAIAEPSEVPVYWLRLCVVQALETTRPTRAATELVQFAVTELASREELQEVFDLATRYGVDALGGTGFALQYVKGVIHYSEARDVHGAEHPATDQAVLRMLNIAEEALATAINQPDASSFRQAAASCRKLVGWSRYFQSKFLAAHDAFEQSAAELSGEEASQALWMAIVCLDKVVEAGGSDARKEELATLIDRFLEDFPSSEHAPRLVLKRASTASQISPDAIAELLAVPDNSDIYMQARNRAAEMLYQLFRSASDSDSAEAGNDYLNVAVPLINLDDGLIVGSEEALWSTRVAIRCRRILEVSLQPEIARLVAARQAFDSLDRLQDEFGVGLTSELNELDYRRIELALLVGAITDAANLADAIYDRSKDTIWARLAARALFRYGYRQWTGSDEADAAATHRAVDNRQAVDLIVRYGLRVIGEYEDDPSALQRTTVSTYFLAVGDASLLVWRRTRNSKDAETAIRLFRTLLTVWPNNTHVLRSTAELAEAVDEFEEALDLWRKLASGLDQADSAWYEARWHQISLLSRLDPARARAVMDQHKQIHPEYGPAPWDERLRELDLDIDPANVADDSARRERDGGSAQ